MTPTRALTIALAKAIDEACDAGAMELAPAAVGPYLVEVARLALQLATRALGALPEGWSLTDDELYGVGAAEAPA